MSQRDVRTQPMDPSKGLPQQSVLRQLRATPRVFTFMAFLLAGSISLGAKEVARWQYIAETFPTEWGVGQAAAASAVSVAIFGFLTGRVADHRDPRPLALLALSIAATGNAIVGVALLSGPLPEWLVLLASVIDGASLGVGGVALLKTQAAFVRPGAEGAAEILNVLRLGIGGVVGAVLAGLSPSPSMTLLVSAGAMYLANIGLWVTMRPVQPRRPTPRTESPPASLWFYLRSSPGLTKVVTLDLILALVIPTQLVNLLLFNLDVPQIASMSIASGMAGVLIGRLTLALVGFRGSPRAIVLATTSSLAVLQILGVISLNDRWILDQPFILPAIIIAGSVCSTYAQGLIAAILQQQVNE